MRNKVMAVYCLGDRPKKKMTVEEIVNVHLVYSQSNGNKVLFTTKKAPYVDMRQKISKIILTTADGKTAMIGDVVENLRYSIKQPLSDFLCRVFGMMKIPIAWFGLK